MRTGTVMMRTTTGIAVAVAVAGGAARAAEPPLPPPMAEVAIGGLTLAYDPSSWTVEGGEGRYVITCIAEACAGVVVDVGVAAEPAGYCSKQDASAAADSLYGLSGGTAVNIHPLGDLALVLATSRTGPGFDQPQAAFACLTRDGQVYRFQSPPTDQEPSPHTGGIILELLRGLTAPPAAIAELRVVEMSLGYRTDVWLPSAAGAASGAVELQCLPPTCHDLGPTVVVAADADGCDPAGLDELSYREDSSDWPLEVRSGEHGAELIFLVDSWWMGCRNATPPQLHACAVRDGVAYRIETTTTGCQVGPWGVPLEAFLELVEGVRLAR